LDSTGDRRLAVIVASSPLGSMALHDPGQCRRFLPCPATGDRQDMPVIIMPDIAPGRIPPDQKPARLPFTEQPASLGTRNPPGNNVRAIMCFVNP